MQRGASAAFRSLRIEITLRCQEVQSRDKYDFPSIYQLVLDCEGRWPPCSISSCISCDNMLFSQINFFYVKP